MSRGIFDAFSKKGITMTMGPGSLHWTASRIRGISPDPNEEDAASDHARDTAFAILGGTAETIIVGLAPDSIEQFEHDLMIHWNFGSKEMILICPSTGTENPRIYREVVKNDRATWTDLLPNASSDSLVDSMKWLLETT
jgi:hypothetical protein